MSNKKYPTTGLEKKYLKTFGGWDLMDTIDYMLYGEEIEGNYHLDLTDYAKELLKPYETDSPFGFMSLELSKGKISFTRNDETSVSFRVELCKVSCP